LGGTRIEYGISERRIISYLAGNRKRKRPACSQIAVLAAAAQIFVKVMGIIIIIIII